MPSGITIEDIRIGDGAPVEKGQTVILHYDGYLNRGDKFRSSRDDGKPIEFVVGKRRIIAGLDKGVLGMRVGGRRRIVVSPHLAYRDEGIEGVVPPNAVLRFEVELLEIR